ncbi:MAG TPA: 3-phosphoglycerate dehydrogenase [Candidatus Copromorpha excrementigallinarum]|uniref:3-phosphoglycerate dehydrogenase n=1 Tax=Candidatus Allocopromorpha excrementigallinarum TaxID=2840742 RepID=A0A9D1I1B7_9FIRM|nr:3-phosphoglycerate dehydrogenase [Candidatus Copromorpha excrementigallinarum]
MYKIGTLNKISPVGLARLTDDYTLTEDISEANAIILRSYDMHEMELPESLLAVGRAGAGVNNIPLDKCAEKGIVVFNAPGANANAVKELCLAGMLMAARNIPAGLKWASSLVGTQGVGKAVEKGKGQFAGTEIQGKTLGVIGLGAIGAMVANAAEGLGMDVIGYDPFLSVKAALSLSNTITIVDALKDLYPKCDYISIHVPVTDDTREMVNADAFAQMKDGAVLLNFARDKLVKDDDMLSALEDGKLRYYVTDFPNDKVIGKPGVIYTPHLGASSAEAEDNCAAMAADEIMDYLENGNITNSVNMPACSLGPRKGARVSIIAKAGSSISEAVASIAKGDMISKTKGDYTYTLADIGDDTDDAASIGIIGDDILRVRIIK